jgi:hypothetical protein
MKTPGRSMGYAPTHVFYHEYRGQLFRTDFDLVDAMRMMDSRISCNKFNPVCLLLIPPTITEVPKLFERFTLYRHNELFGFVYVPRVTVPFDRERVVVDGQYEEVEIVDSGNVYRDRIPQHWQAQIMTTISEEENVAIKELLASLPMNKKEEKKPVIVRQHIP